MPDFDYEFKGANLRAGDIVRPFGDSQSVFEIVEFGRSGSMYREAKIELWRPGGTKVSSNTQIHHGTWYDVKRSDKRVTDPYGIANLKSYEERQKRYEKALAATKEQKR